MASFFTMPISTEAKEDKLKYIVYDFSGRFIKKILLPYQGRMVFDGGRFYQLLENEETETWELHVNKVN